MPQNINNPETPSSPQGEWIGYWEEAVTGERELKLPEQFTILVVLDGEVMLTFNRHDRKTVGQKSLIVIDQKQLTNFKWKAGMAVLIYTPPKKIFRFFSSCSTVFKVPCSTIVPIRPELQKWIDDLMEERLQPKEMLTESRCRSYCVRLGNILRGYPPLLIGELRIPFQACSMSGSEKCEGELCE